MVAHRTRWATEVRATLDAIETKLRELNAQAEAIKAECNHTKSDGASLLQTYVGRDTRFTKCPVCGWSEGKSDESP